MPEPVRHRPVSRRAFGGLVLASGLAALGLAACAPMPRGSRPSQSSRTPTSAPGVSRGRGLVWSDEFDGPASAGLAASRWLVAERSDNPNNELEAYTARRENVSLDGSGSLRITARSEVYSATPLATRNYTSGRIESVEAFRYGRIEARIKVPAGPGLWPAFWTIGRYDGSVQWPVTGEIDIMETVDDATTIHANVHADSTSAGPWTDEGTVPSPTSFADDFHVYSVDWSEDELVFEVDGTEFHRVRREDRPSTDVWEFDRPQYVLLNLAVGGDFPRNKPEPSAFPAEMLVDYVRVYDSEIFPRLE